MNKHSIATFFALLSFCVSGLLTSCGKSNEEKAKDLIDEQLQLSLHDYGSYEPVEFGKLDSTYSSAFDLPEYNDAVNKAKHFKDEGNDKVNDAELYGRFGLYERQVEYAREGKILFDSAMFYVNKAAKIDSSFVPEFVGWGMTHTFRANNKFGNKVIAHRKYYFDKDFTKIIGEDILDE